MGNVERVLVVLLQQVEGLGAREAGLERRGVGVGGGSSMDCAKSINLLRYNEGPILRFAGPNVPMNLSPGVILIPTTSGTGSEVPSRTPQSSQSRS